MKKIVTTIAVVLMAVSVFADDGVRSLPIAVPKAYWGNAEKKEAILEALCTFIGLPNNAESKAVVMVKFDPKLVTNVVGNASLGIPAGSDFYLSCNSAQNYFGSQTAWAQDKLDNMKANTNATPWMLMGEWCGSPDAWIGTNYWGIISQEVAPE